MISDQDLMLASAARAAAVTGRETVAAELLARIRAELPTVTAMGEREQLLAAAWLMSLRAPRTRRAYVGDLDGWLTWLGDRGADVLAATRVHVDLWVAAQQEHGAEASTVRRRLSALSSLYRYCAAHDLADRNPVEGVARPVVDPDYTATIGLDRDLLDAADRDTGAQALRTAAAVRLLLHNALRVDEACAADIADLGADAGHRVLRVTRKGARKAKIPLTPATVAPLDDYLSDRARRAGLDRVAELAGGGHCWPPPPAAASGRATCGNWSAGSPAQRVSRPGRTCRRIHCDTRRSSSPSTPAGSGGCFMSWLSTGLRGTRAVYSDAYNRSARGRAVAESQSAGMPERARSAPAMTGGHRARVLPPHSPVAVPVSPLAGTSSPAAGTPVPCGWRLARCPAATRTLRAAGPPGQWRIRQSCYRLRHACRVAGQRWVLQLGADRAPGCAVDGAGPAPWRRPLDPADPR
jgi:integrase